jgi:hypothetical protein
MNVPDNREQAGNGVTGEESCSTQPSKQKAKQTSKQANQQISLG